MIEKLSKNISNSAISKFFQNRISSFKTDKDVFTDIVSENRPYSDPIKIGYAELKNHEELLVFTCEYNKELTNRSAKKEQFEIAKKVLKDDFKDGAIFIFYDALGNFRFSFIRRNYGDKAAKYSNWKRYTYYVEPTKQNKTFKTRIENCHFDSLDNIQEAFSVEPLNRQFYQQIAKAFYELISGKYNLGSKTIAVEKPMLVLPSTPYKGNETIHKEFAVRLIGRTIFCWFLKNKKSSAGIPLIPEDWLSSASVVKGKRDYYHSVLEKLFFLVLNKKMEDRYGYNLPDGADNIPFLNGGLFEAHIDDFFANNQSNYALKIPDEWFKSLFETLEQYNFTIDENSINDTEVSIDPEMLGTIFENLLAEIDPDTEKSARKATGSFYTPREIVDYMVEQAMVQYLKTKTTITDEEELVQLFQEGQAVAKDPNFTETETLQLLEALSTVKILDPACGSGAFPMGALQKICLALEKLDPSAEWWKEQQVKLIPNAIAKKNLKEKLDKSTSDYARKLGVIQNSIYGVDIQPIAAEISKLRSFLSLVIDENIDDEDYNRGIEPLPNLEFKFVTANTLVSLPEEQGQQVSMFDNFEQLEQLAQLRADYLQCSGDKKENIKNQFLKVQKKAFTKEHNLFADQNSRSYKIISWNPFKNEPSSWFDPQWMFGVEKFDVVIGNPPYVDSETMVLRNPSFRTELKEAYSFAVGNWDLFIVFIERGIDLLKDKGIFSYIIPNKIISAKYALTARENINKLGIIEVRDYSRINVFANADVYPITMTLINNTELHSPSMFTIMESLTEVKNCNKINNDVIIDTLWDKYFYDSEIFKLLIKLSNFKKLMDINVNVTGAATVSEAYKIKEFLFDKEFHNDSFKLINTGTIDPYLSLWSIKNTQYIKDSYVYPRIKANDIKSISINRFNQASAPKIIIAGMSNIIESFLDLNGDYLAGKSTSIILTEIDKLMYLTGLLNSKLASFFVNKSFHSLKMAGGYLNINNNIISRIPVSNEYNSDIINQVDLLINRGGVFEEIIQTIDILIYKDFELNHDEVLIVDPDFDLSQEEYDNYKI
jgi:hypothetical protein